MQADKTTFTEIRKSFKGSKDEEDFIDLALTLESDTGEVSNGLMSLIVDIISDCYGLDSLVAAEDEKAAQRLRQEIIAQKKGKINESFLKSDAIGDQVLSPRQASESRPKGPSGTIDFLKVFLALLQLCDPSAQIEHVSLLNKRIEGFGLYAEVELDKRKGIMTLLDSLQRTSKSYSNILTKEILKLLSTMIGYSIRIHEVKKVLTFIMGTNNPMLIKEKPFYFNNLLEVLRVASITPREGPRCFFNFSCSSSGLSLPQFTLPSSGYTFIMWVRLEHVGNTYLASFTTNSGNGAYLYVHNKHLVLHYRVGKDDVTLLQKCVLTPRAWHMIAITHTYKVVLKSELSVNINGHPTFTQGVTYPKFEEPFTASFIGNNDPDTHKSAFEWAPMCGQVGDFMLIEGPLDAQEIRAVYRSRTLGQNGPMLVLPKRSAKLVFSYTPLAVRGVSCMDTAALTDLGRCAKMLGDTALAYRFPLNEALLNAGGIKLLLPLFRQIGLPAAAPKLKPKSEDENEDEIDGNDESDEKNEKNENAENDEKDGKDGKDTEKGDDEAVVEKSKDSVASNSQALDQRFLHGIYSCDFFSLLGYIFSSDNFRHELWTESALNELFGLLSVTGRHDQIRRRSLEEILFNFSIWVHTSTKIQSLVIAHIAEKIKAEPLYFRERLGVQGILDIARTYYWFSKEAGYKSYGESQALPTRDVVRMRMQLLKLLPLLTGGNFTQTEVRTIVIYIIDCEDDAQCIDLMQLLVSFAGYRNKSVLGALLEIDSMVWLPILARQNDTLRAWTLKLVCYILQESAGTPGKLEINAVIAGLYHTLKLGTLKRIMFFSLIELLLGQVTPNCKHINPIGFIKTIEVKFPLILPVIIDLVISSPHQLQLIVLKDIKFLESVLGHPFLRLVPAKKWFTNLIKLISQLQDKSHEVLGENNTEDGELRSELLEVSTAFLGNVVASSLLAASNVANGEMLDLFAELLRTESRGTVALICQKTLGALVGTEEDEKSTLAAAQASPYVVRTALLRWCSLAAAGVFVWDGGAAPGMKPAERMTVAPGPETRLSQDLLDFAVRLNKIEDKLPPSSGSNEAQSGGKAAADAFGDDWGRFVDVVLMKLAFLVLCETDSLAQIHKLENKKDDIGRMDTLVTKSINSLSVAPTTLSTAALTSYLSARLARWNEEAALATKEFSLCKTSFVSYVEHTIRKLPPDAARSKTFYVLALLKDSMSAASDPERQGCIKHVFYDIVTQAGKGGPFGDTKDPEAVFKEFEEKVDRAAVTAECAAETELLTRLGAELLRMRDSLVAEAEMLEWSASAGFEAMVSSGRIHVAGWREAIVERKLSAPDQIALSERWKQFVFNSWPTRVEHWKLDASETSSGMRCRMVPNFLFDPHNVKCRSDDDDSALLGSPTLSVAKGEDGAVGDPPAVRERTVSKSKAVEENEEPDSAEDSDDEDDNDEGSEASKTPAKMKTYIVSLIEPVTATSGNFIVFEDTVRFVPRHRGGLNTLQSIGPNECAAEFAVKVCDIAHAYKRRYLLRDCALEIYTADRASHLFLFASEDARNRALIDIGACGGAETKALFAPKNLVPVELLKKSKLTEAWTARMISNYEYLMRLNALSGRTFNDLSQYPVFPWVIADYTSETLDLKNFKTFRDLSKPMGALTQQRVENAMASIDTVLYYMIRVEPFTTYALEYGGGEFDYPDRMFNDVGKTFANTVRELVPEFYCLPEMFVNENRFGFLSKDAPSSNSSGLVDKDVGDVYHNQKYSTILPPWAKGSPHEFVRLNREALESEFVSEHLQEWVDLIWGFKQKGDPAVKALNTYPDSMYPRTTHSVTFFSFSLTSSSSSASSSSSSSSTSSSSTETETTRKMLRKIYNDGMMPEQLFKKAHPKRFLRALVKKPLPQSYRDTQYPIVPRENLPAPVVRIFAGPKELVFLCRDGFYAQCSVETSVKSGPSITSKPDKCISAPVSGSSASPAVLAAQQQQMVELPACACEARLCDTVAYCVEGAALLNGGVWDGTLRVRSPKAKVYRKVGVAENALTCLAYDGGFLVAGTSGASMPVFDLRECRKDPTVLVKPRTSGSDPLATPLHFLGGHMCSLRAVAVCEDLDIIVSASCGDEPACLVHTLRKGTFLREIKTAAPVDAIFISRCGYILLYSAASGELESLSANCAPLAKAKIPPANSNSGNNNGGPAKEGPSLPMAVSPDGRIVAVVPGDKTTLEVLLPHNLCSIKSISLSGNVEALGFTADSNFVIVSYADGNVAAVYVGHLVN